MRSVREKDQGVNVSRALFMALCLIALPAMIAAARHPFHVSIAQAEVAIGEDGMKVLQVAMRVDPDDLERALEARTRTPISLEKTENVDELISAYLAEVFLARHPAKDEDDEPRPLEPCPPVRNEKEEKRDTPPTTRPDDEGGEDSSIIRWVGKELEIRYAWLYFEVCLPETGLDGLEFSSRAFFEFEPEQINTVKFKEGDWRRSLRFTPRESWKTILKDVPRRR